MYFSAMTFIFIFRTLAADPGYVDTIKYAHPLNPDGTAPLVQLRLLNTKMFQKLKLYDFDADEEASGLIDP